MAIVAPDKLDAFLAVTAKWDVETSVLGEVTGDGRLQIFWHGDQIVDVDPSTVAVDGPVQTLLDKNIIRIAGRAELTAQRVSSRLSTLRPMGSYRLALQGGDVPTLTLSTLEGHLQLSGSGQWVGNRLRFAGEASAAPEREAALSNLLNIIGRRSGARSIITVG